MTEEKMGLRVKIEWKLEKFEGEKKEEDLPVETLSGTDYVPLIPKETPDADR